MTTKEILTIENGKPEGTVILFEEGLFAKAYEESAWRLAMRFGLKPTKRYVKVVDMEVVSVGFPLSGIDERLPGTVRDGQIMRVALTVDSQESSFAGWKAALQQKRLTQPPAAPQGVAGALRAFSVENSTPVECMLFVSRLKKMLQNEKQE